VLVTPYCEGHSLHDALLSNGPYGRGGVGGRIGEARLLVAARSIAKGMRYLHDERSLVHNDLKPKNILLSSVRWGMPPPADGAGGAEEFSTCPHVKIGDFGLSTIGGSGLVGDGERGMVGTDPYMAPEMIQSTGLGGDEEKKKCDVFSFGMLLLTIVERKEPWQEEINQRPGKDEVRRWVVEQVTITREAKKRRRRAGRPERKVVEEGRPIIPPHVSKAYSELIHKCWHQKPQHRPGFGDVCDALTPIRQLLDLNRTLGLGVDPAESPITFAGSQSKGVARLPESLPAPTFEALHEAVTTAGGEGGGATEATPPLPWAQENQAAFDKIARWVHQWQHFE